METTRRDFLKAMGIATVCACTGIAGLNGCSMVKGVSNTEAIPEGTYQLIENKLILQLDQIACLKETGGAGKLTLEKEGPVKIIVVQHQPGTYKAFSDCCTHGGRELNYKHEDESLQCSSFGHSTFALSNGKPLKGPAEGPLSIYPVHVVNNTLTITLA